MLLQESLLVTLVKLVDGVPMPGPPTRGRGRPRVYPDRLFLKALVIMMVRRLHKVNEFLAVLAEPTPEMHALRALLTDPRGACRAAGPGSVAWWPSQPPCPPRLGIWDATWWLCSTPGPIAPVPPPLIAPCCAPWAVFGTRKTGRLASSRIPRLIPKPTGPNRAGMAGCMAGNCTSSARRRASGFPSRPSAPPPMLPITSRLRAFSRNSPWNSAFCWGTSIITIPTWSNCAHGAVAASSRPPEGPTRTPMTEWKSAGSYIKPARSPLRISMRVQRNLRGPWPSAHTRLGRHPPFCPRCDLCVPTGFAPSA